MEKIGIIGHFGGKEQFTDGQTVKTKVIYEEFLKTGKYDIKTVDTYYKSHNPIKLVFDTFSCLLTRKKIIVLLSKSGKKFYFPILYWAKKLLKTKVYHSVIAGGLADQAKENRNWVKYLDSFEINWVETHKMKEGLEKMGVKNAVYMPNFKRLNILSENEVKLWEGEPYRFCTFSRVMKEKGIEDAIAAIESLNKKHGKKLCTLDIYGNVDASYTEAFKAILNSSSDAVCYKGVVPFDKSVEAIKDYYALLFPTYWQGEGFAGTVVDGFSAGLPIIATDWSANAEIIKNGSNGIVYPNDTVNDLYSAIEWSIENPDEMNRMKTEAVRSAETYRPERFIEEMINAVNNR